MEPGTGSGSIRGEGSAGSLRVRQVCSLEELRALRDSWDALLARSETSTPFLCHDWILSWWESFGEGQDLWVLVLEDDEGPAGIAPLTRVKRWVGPVSYRVLELIGTGRLRFLGMGLADRADLMLARRHRECISAILGVLAAERQHWDVLDLRFVPEDSSTVGGLTRSAAEAELGLGSQPCAISPYLTLEGSFKDYMASRSRSTRRGLKRRLKELEQRGAIRFELDRARSDDLSQALAAVLEVSRGSWKTGAGSALLLHKNVWGFIERLLPRLVARDAAYLALLWVGDDVAAHELGFRMNNKLWSYDSAFKRRYMEGSPGVQLTTRLLESAWSRNLAEYDFLRGDEPYKLDWNSGCRRELQLVLDAGHVHARTARSLAFAAKWALKRQRWLLRSQAWLAGRLNRLLQ